MAVGPQKERARPTVGVRAGAGLGKPQRTQAPRQQPELWLQGAAIVGTWGHRA